MFVVFFLFWVLLNGRWTIEIAIFGIVIAGAMYAFICRFMDYSIRKDLRVIRKIPLSIVYCAVLIREIVKANLAMLPYIFSAKIMPEPKLVRFQTELKTHTAQMILANSITLTPGTITVEMDDGHYLVHCFDKSMGEGLDSSVFVKWLKRLEEE
ncbi:MAG: Na+/H+ antiporter subunit E [Clostridiales bacterium]|nr:Na+/H+ antiporter subunit E [Clostridiales bacterium]